MLLSDPPEADQWRTAGGDDEKRLDIQSNDGVLSILARASEIALPAPGDRVPPSEPSGHSVTGRLLVLTDITELTRAIQVRSDFVANASHELRTPISAIRAAVDTVLKIDVAKDAEDAKRFLGVIARHTARLEALVGDLLDLSRLENPSATFQPEILRLQRLCDELHDRWIGEIDGKKLRWRCDIGDDCPNVFANPYLLTLVLDNLVDNAVKFTEPGGQIGVGCRCEGAAVEIEVFDTGCGIATHEHQRVFERFYQVEAARSATGNSAARPRGTGLGLSIIKHAVAAMGGSVHLDSAPGRGTRVTVRIPNPQHSETKT
jgi:signal transduction histidine kinase